MCIVEILYSESCQGYFAHYTLQSNDRDTLEQIKAYSSHKTVDELSLPQLNLNSTLHDKSWVWHENDFTPPTTTLGSILDSQLNWKYACKMKPQSDRIMFFQC